MISQKQSEGNLKLEHDIIEKEPSPNNEANFLNQNNNEKIYDENKKVENCDIIFGKTQSKESNNISPIPKETGFKINEIHENFEELKKDAVSSFNGTFKSNQLTNHFNTGNNFYNSDNVDEKKSINASPEKSPIDTKTDQEAQEYNKQTKRSSCFKINKNNGVKIVDFLNPFYQSKNKLEKGKEIGIDNKGSLNPFFQSKNKVEKVKEIEIDNKRSKELNVNEIITNSPKKENHRVDEKTKTRNTLELNDNAIFFKSNETNSYKSSDEFSDKIEMQTQKINNNNATAFKFGEVLKKLDAKIEFLPTIDNKESQDLFKNKVENLNISNINKSVHSHSKNNDSFMKGGTSFRSNSKTPHSLNRSILTMSKKTNNDIFRIVCPDLNMNIYNYSRRIVKQIKLMFRLFYDNREHYLTELKKQMHLEKIKQKESLIVKQIIKKPDADKSTDFYKKQALEVRFVIY